MGVRALERERERERENFFFFLICFLLSKIYVNRIVVFVGVEGKVEPRSEGYTWVPKPWSFVKLHEVGNFPTFVISILKDI